MDAESTKSDGAAACDSTKMEADNAKIDTASCKSTKVETAGIEADSKATCEATKSDASKLNGGPDSDHSTSKKPPEEEQIELTPSGRPRRKVTMKTPSPDKLNGYFELDVKPRSSPAKKKAQANAQLKGNSTKRRLSGREANMFVNQKLMTQGRANGNMNPAFAQSFMNKGNMVGFDRRKGYMGQNQAGRGNMQIMDIQHSRANLMNKNMLQFSGHQRSAMFSVSVSNRGVTSVNANNGGMGNVNFPARVSAGTSAAAGIHLMRGPGGLTATYSGFQAGMKNTFQNQNLMRNQAPFVHPGSLVTPTFNSQVIRQPNPMTSILANMPEKPTSSKGMMEMIRWEVENHINIKPKYVRQNPKAELGNLAKWVFDLGSDIAKEFVYHELVTVQTRRDEDGSLTDKEKEDFVKLKEVEQELNKKVGHFKYPLNRSCRCGFRTELANVKYLHQQHAHIEKDGMLRCGLCKYSIRQPSAFRFHMESEHGRAGFVENRPSFYECSLCPYETNYANRLEQHQVKCQRNFKEGFNLHSSSVTGPEVNLCLENVFYYIFTNRFMNPTPRPLTQIAASSPANTTQSRNVSSPATPALPAPNTPGHRMTGQFQQRQGAGHVGMSPQQSQAMASHNMPNAMSKGNLTPTQAMVGASPTGAQQNLRPNQANTSNKQSANGGFEVCEICGGYVKDRKALRIHFFYAHRIDMPFSVFERPQAPLYCATCFARFWTAQGLQKHIEVHKKDSMNTTQAGNGVAGKCILCSHRVPNILLHMRMVHNREMNHYLVALMCIFCGCRFKTRREVENHIVKMHSVAVKGNQMGPNMPPAPSSNRSGPSQPVNSPATKPASTPTTKSSTGVKPVTPRPGPASKTEGRNKCVLCNVGFHRNVDLTRHCMRVHHTCMKCGLVVVDKESLSRHNCLPCASGMRICHLCDEEGFHPAYYIKHMRDKHLRKCSVILRRLDQAIVETLKRPITISDSEDEEGEPISKQSKLEGEEDAQEAERIKTQDIAENNAEERENKTTGNAEERENKTTGNAEERENKATGNAEERENKATGNAEERENKTTGKGTVNVVNRNERKDDAENEQIIPAADGTVIERPDGTDKTDSQQNSPEKEPEGPGSANQLSTSQLDSSRSDSDVAADSGKQGETKNDSDSDRADTVLESEGGVENFAEKVLLNGMAEKGDCEQNVGNGHEAENSGKKRSLDRSDSASGEEDLKRLRLSSNEDICNTD